MHVHIVFAYLLVSCKLTEAYSVRKTTEVEMSKCKVVEHWRYLDFLCHTAIFSSVYSYA